MTDSNTLHRFARLAVALIVSLSTGIAFAAVNPQVPIAGSSLPQFVDPLPILSLTGGTMPTFVTANTSLANPFQVSMCEFKTRVLPSTWVPPVGSSYQGFTWTWGYVAGPTCPAANDVKDTYIGPVLVNVKGIPTTVRYTNSLPTLKTTNLLAYKYSTDQTVHWADPLMAEMNMCHMDSGNPPQVGVGIPAFHSDCSLNFGEYIDALGQSQFNPVGIPATPHLHGGEVPPAIDGGPDTWFTSDGLMKGHDYYTNPLVPVAGNEAVYSYPNAQGQAPLWFHDHTMGATRLNVYAGIAGAYYLIDPAQESLNPASPGWFEQIGMRPLTELVPVVLQDRMFDANGQLYYPSGFPGGINGPPPNPQHPYWNPEFIGDTILVNGKVWPFLSVQPRRYRFLFLNGSNARTYEMFLINQATGAVGPSFSVIGNDGGILDKAATVPRLVIMPGERYELIIDFKNFAGQNLIIRNVAKAPYPGGASAKGSTTGRIMQFRVLAGAVVDTSYDPAAANALPLRPSPMVRLVNRATGQPAVTPAKVRQLTLNEALLAPQTAIDPVTGLLTAYPGGPVEILVNNTLYSGESKRGYGDFTPVTIGGITQFVTETPSEGDVELWEIVNTTMDAHPIHTHLATFQVLNRQPFDMKGFMMAYGMAFPGDGSAACPMGVYCPGFGPPLDIRPSAASGNKWGGNPDVTPFLGNKILPPAPEESGWKDTFLALPGVVNRFLVRFSPTETALGTVAGYPFSPNDGTNGSLNDSHGYVWHCHIIDHEDNEMMRPDVVAPLVNAPRTFVKGVDY